MSSHLQRVYERVQNAPFSYNEKLVGHTQVLVTQLNTGQTIERPASFHLSVRRERLATFGDEHETRVFELAGRHVLSWGMHRGAGLRVIAAEPEATPDKVVVCGFGIGSARIAAPCRTIWTVNTETTRGFGYGTLPGHPESGEEAFCVHRDHDGVWLTILAFSKPGRWFTKLGTPAGRLIQRHVTNRYIQSVKAAIAPGGAIPQDL